MVGADSHVVWDQFNTEGPMGHTFCHRRPSRPYNNSKLLGRDSWIMNTAHVSSFVLISILRGQPKTPPSGDYLCNRKNTRGRGLWGKTQVSARVRSASGEPRVVPHKPQVPSSSF